MNQNTNWRVDSSQKPEREWFKAAAAIISTALTAFCMALEHCLRTVPVIFFWLCVGLVAFDPASLSLLVTQHLLLYGILIVSVALWGPVFALSSGGYGGAATANCSAHEYGKSAGVSAISQKVE